MCNKKESKVPALFFSTCKSKCVWSSLNSSSENTTESRSWGALWRVAKGLLCKVEFPTCFLVNTELFPIWLALCVGWFQLHSQPHLRLFVHPDGEDICKQNRVICRSWRKRVVICSPHSALITGQPAAQGHVVWTSETFPHLPLWLYSIGKFFGSHPNFSTSSTLHFSSQIALSFRFSSHYPSLVQLFSVVTPDSSHPVRLMPAHHHHELRDDWVYSTKSTHKSILPAALWQWPWTPELDNERASEEQIYHIVSTWALVSFPYPCLASQVKV